jgi:hypothetical protein
MKIVLHWVHNAALSAAMDAGNGSVDVISVATTLFLQTRVKGELGRAIFTLRKVCGRHCCSHDDGADGGGLAGPWGLAADPTEALLASSNDDYQSKFDRVALLSLWTQLQGILQADLVQAEKKEQSALYQWSTTYHSVQMYLGARACNDMSGRVKCMELACCCLRNLPIIPVPDEEGRNDGKRLPLVTPDLYEQIKQFMQLQDKDVHSLKESFDMLMDTDLKGVEKRGMAGDMLDLQLLILQKMHPNYPLAPQQLEEFVSIVAVSAVDEANELVSQHRRDFLIHGLLASVWPGANFNERETLRRRGMKRLVLGTVYRELTRGQPLTTMWTNALVGVACYAPAYLSLERAASPAVMQQPLADSLFSFFRRQDAADLGRLPTAQLFHQMRQAFTNAKDALDSSLHRLAAVGAAIDDAVREDVGKAMVVLVNMASTRHVFINHVKQLMGEGFESMRAKVENQLAEQHRKLMLEVFITPAGSDYQSLLMHLVLEDSTHGGRIFLSQFLAKDEHCRVLGEWAKDWRLSFSSDEEQLELHRRVIEACKTIRDMMILRCPNEACKVPFADYNGCLAFTCGDVDMPQLGGCGAHFCGWCLKLCGNDAHSHLKSGECTRQPAHLTKSYFGEKMDFEVSLNIANTFTFCAHLSMACCVIGAFRLSIAYGAKRRWKNSLVISKQKGKHSGHYCKRLYKRFQGTAVRFLKRPSYPPLRI